MILWITPISTPIFPEYVNIILNTFTLQNKKLIAQMITHMPNTIVNMFYVDHTSIQFVFVAEEAYQVAVFYKENR